MQPRLLVVDDALEHHYLIRQLFARQYVVQPATSLAEADRELSKSSFDLILLDLQLPDGDGFSYFVKLKEQEQTRDIPVIFITSSGETPKEVMGFSLGAEDYIVKPIEPARLRARIEAKMRQILSRRENELILQKGNLRMVVSMQRVTIVQGGVENQVNLTQVEFKMLLYFLRHEDQVLSREQILTAVWGNAAEVFDRTVDMHISNLRKKIVGSEYSIHAVTRAGYRFIKSESA